MLEVNSYSEVGLEAPSRPSVGAAHKQKKKTIEQRYQKKSQLEHILLRPDSYVGSTEFHQQNLWVWDKEKERMVQRNISFVPGLYKIFDEILVNAADVKAREVQTTEQSGGAKKMKMTAIKVDLDVEERCVSIWNDGEGIPIEIHKEHNIYVPELIFGHLLTSDNYDDSDLRVTGGRNGYGAKLTNIFSDTFTVECGDAQRKRRFKMTWNDNMQKKGKVSVKEYGGEDFVKVTFKPDFPKFGMTGFDDDIVALIMKRVYDVAGTSGVRVFFNGKRLMVKDFKSYVNLYFDPPSSEGDSSANDEIVKIHEKQWRWEVMICQSDGSQFQQVSFVNSICTPKGGTHVSHVTDPLVQAILKKANSKNRGGMEIKPIHVRTHLWVFINCLVVNPSFDSQTKETLTTKAVKLGSKCVLSDKTINAVCKSAIVENIVLWAQTKQQVELKKQLKTGGTRGKDRLSGIPKLEDANFAGGKHAQHCTLIITEGDSAKTSCLAGLSVLGRDRYGVFPLKGKLLNVRDASFNQLKDNKEIQNIMKILGLQVTDKIESSKGLRYGSMMIMTDQDHDGSHIKGLLINLFHFYWPNLLKCNSFLKEFATPIVKAVKGAQEKTFFTIKEYEDWKNQIANSKAWKIKYYKGLGTSTNQEFKEYFSKFEMHQLKFKWEGDVDGEAIDMAFNKKRAEDRKVWIQSYEDGNQVDHAQHEVSYCDFINKELVQFSRYDTERSVPCLVDGLKPGQRKVLFAVFKRNLKTECKVAQLTGYVAEHSAYHHGEVSLQQTIVNMAQNFVGSNNINFLEPCGQFGSRNEGGKDASAARYIFTQLALATRTIFHEFDDPLLSYHDDDGQRIEPHFYVPVIPAVLVNGAEGIGTGWSSSVPNYNPRDIIANLRRYLNGKEFESMTPWYKRFKGTIEPNGRNGFDTVGIVEKIDEETVEITELPVKKWTQDYKEWIEENLITADGREGLFADYRDNSSHEDISFTIKLTSDKMERATREGLEKFFRLRSTISTSNMTLFDNCGKIHKYATELDILKEFTNVRLLYYKKRKAYILARLEREKMMLDNRVRFILLVVASELIVSNKRKTVLIEELFRKGFDPLFEINKLLKGSDERESSAVEDENDDEEDSAVGFTSKEYDYLLGMPIWSLTLEKVEELKRQLREKDMEISTLKMLSIEALWLKDLDAIEAALGKQEEIDEAALVAGKKFKAARRDSLTKHKSIHSKGKAFAKPSLSGKKAGADGKRSTGTGVTPKSSPKKPRRKLESSEEEESSEEATDDSFDSDALLDNSSYSEASNSDEEGASATRIPSYNKSSSSLADDVDERAAEKSSTHTTKRLALETPNRRIKKASSSAIRSDTQRMPGQLISDFSRSSSLLNGQSDSGVASSRDQHSDLEAGDIPKLPGVNERPETLPKPSRVEPLSLMERLKAGRSSASSTGKIQLTLEDIFGRNKKKEASTIEAADTAVINVNDTAAATTDETSKPSGFRLNTYISSFGGASKSCNVNSLNIEGSEGSDDCAIVQDQQKISKRSRSSSSTAPASSLLFQLNKDKITKETTESTLKGKTSSSFQLPREKHAAIQKKRIFRSDTASSEDRDSDSVGVLISGTPSREKKRSNGASSVAYQSDGDVSSSSLVSSRINSESKATDADQFRATPTPLRNLRERKRIKYTVSSSSSDGNDEGSDASDAYSD